MPLRFQKPSNRDHRYGNATSISEQTKGPAAEILKKGARFMGKTFKYGDNVNTDVIIPARYLNTSEPDELAKHAMEDLDATFVSRVHPGDIIVAGKNFGSGSSREHAPMALKAAGVEAVIAESFARIFYRNAFNIGFPLLESKEAADAIRAGDEVEIDFRAGTIRNKTKNETYTAQPLPPFMAKLVESGGLVGYIKTKAAK
jgi:3-isopropylmalate/(R)-2-methylmalate dehydratase small subunit